MAGAMELKDLVRDVIDEIAQDFQDQDVQDMQDRTQDDAQDKTLDLASKPLSQEKEQASSKQENAQGRTQVILEHKKKPSLDPSTDLSLASDLSANSAQAPKQTITPSVQKQIPQQPPQKSVAQKRAPQSKEEEFLDALKERLNVLFEGLHSPALKDKETKLNLTINFLEYALAQIENRLDELS